MNTHSRSTDSENPNESDNERPPTVNGVPLVSLESVENAFSYLGDDYNDGSINRNLSGNKVVIHFRGARVEHWHKIRDSPAIEVTDMRCDAGHATIDVQEV